MRFIVLCALLLLPATVLAQPEVVEVPVVDTAPADELSDIYLRHYLPQGKRVMLLDEELMAFNFEDYLILLRMDSDLHELKLQKPELERKVDHYLTAYEEERAANNHNKEALVVCKTDAERLDTTLTTTVSNNSKRMHRVQRRSKIGWGLAGVSTGGLIALLLGLVLGG